MSHLSISKKQVQLEYFTKVHFRRLMVVLTTEHQT